MNRSLLVLVAVGIFTLGILTAPVLNILSIPATRQLASSPTPAPTTSDTGMKPTDLSFGLPSAFAQVSDTQAKALIQSGAKVKEITLIAKEEDVTLPQGDVIHAMTFNGTVPPPTLRATQGDLIKITMINDKSNKLIHSIDMHPSIISAVPNYGPVNPGQNKTYSFVALNSGFFKYHCEGNAVLGMDQHVFSGMAGGFIIDPKNGYYGFPDYRLDNSTGQLVRKHIDPQAKEVTLVFSEWYTSKNGDYNQTAMFAHLPTYTTMNGIPFGYDPVITKTKGAMPLHFKQGDHVRFFLLNVGDVPVFFHIVGEQLDRVTDGQLVNGYGKQTYLVGGSNDAIVDVVFDTPGVFAMVNHDYASLFKGQAGLVVVDGPDGEPGKSLGLTNYKNPSNAIPPLGVDSISVDTTPYYLGSPNPGTSTTGVQSTNQTISPSGNQTLSKVTNPQVGQNASQTNGNSTSGNSTSSNSNSTSANSVSIVSGAQNLADKAFNPNPISVKVGDTVTWTNNDNAAHTVTSGNGSTGTPDGVFDSGILQPHKTFSYTFTKAGTYNYYCQLHPTMTGEVDVS